MSGDSLSDSQFGDHKWQRENLGDYSRDHHWRAYGGFGHEVENSPEVDSARCLDCAWESPYELTHMDHRQMAAEMHSLGMKTDPNIRLHRQRPPVQDDWGPEMHSALVRTFHPGTQAQKDAMDPLKRIAKKARGEK